MADRIFLCCQCGIDTLRRSCECRVDTTLLRFLQANQQSDAEHTWEPGNPDPHPTQYVYHDLGDP